MTAGLDGYMLFLLFELHVYFMRCGSEDHNLVKKQQQQQQQQHQQNKQTNKNFTRILPKKKNKLPYDLVSADLIISLPGHGRVLHTRCFRAAPGHLLPPY